MFQYNLLLFDTDYVINLSCAVFCFSTWKEMIDPWSLGEKFKRLFRRKNRTENHPKHSHHRILRQRIIFIKTE